MAKKIEIEKISPRKCLSSITEYHECVVQLVTSLQIIENHIPAEIWYSIKPNLDAVTSFYDK